MVTPASMQMSSSRRAPTASVPPQAAKNSPRPPNVAVPKLRTGTLKPEAPRRRYSIFSSAPLCQDWSVMSGLGGCEFPAPGMLFLEAQNLPGLAVRQRRLVADKRPGHRHVRAPALQEFRGRQVGGDGVV